MSLTFTLLKCAACEDLHVAMFDFGEVMNWKTIWKGETISEMRATKRI
jgi:hypothetical protein